MTIPELIAKGRRRWPSWHIGGLTLVRVPSTPETSPVIGSEPVILWSLKDHYGIVRGTAKELDDYWYKHVPRKHDHYFRDSRSPTMSKKVEIVIPARGEEPDGGFYYTSYRLPLNKVAKRVDSLATFHQTSVSNIVISLLLHSLPQAETDVTSTGAELPQSSMQKSKHARPEKEVKVVQQLAVKKTPELKAAVKKMLDAAGLPQDEEPIDVTPKKPKALKAKPKTDEEEVEIEVPKPKKSFKVKMQLKGGKVK